MSVALLVLLAAEGSFLGKVVGVTIGVVIVLFLLLAVFGYATTNQPLAQRLNRWRLPKIAAQLGMSYDPEARGLGQLGCKGLPVLQAGTEVRNLLHGTVNGVERLAVEVRRPKITDPAYFLVIGYRLRGRKLPPFSVELKGLVDNASVDEEAAEFLGENPYRDPGEFHGVEVTGNQAFVKYFAVLALRLEDKPAVQSVLTREVQDAFMLHRTALERTGAPHLELQGAGEWLAVILPHAIPPRLAALTSRMDYERPVFEAFSGKGASR